MRARLRPSACEPSRARVISVPPPSPFLGPLPELSVVINSLEVVSPQDEVLSVAQDEFKRANVVDRILRAAQLAIRR